LLTLQKITKVESITFRVVMPTSLPLPWQRDQPWHSETEQSSSDWTSYKIVIYRLHRNTYRNDN